MRESRLRLSLGMGLGIVAVSCAALLIRLAQPLPPLAIATGRQLLAGLCLALFSFSAVRESLRALDRRRLLLVLASSLLLALHFYGWIASLSLTSVIRATTLVSTSPIIAALLARFNDDRVPKGLYLGCVVALAGAALMSLGASGAAGRSSLVGDALALLGAVTAAGYLSVGRKLQGDLPLAGYLVLVNLGSGLWLGLAGLATGAFANLDSLRPADLGWVFALAVVPGVVGHGLMNWAVRQVPVHVVSTVLLLEAVLAPLLVWVVLSEGIGPYEAIGGGVVVSGVLQALRPQAEPKPSAKAKANHEAHAGQERDDGAWR